MFDIRNYFGISMSSSVQCLRLLCSVLVLAPFLHASIMAYPPSQVVGPENIVLVMRLHVHKKIVSTEPLFSYPYMDFNTPLSVLILWAARSCSTVRGPFSAYL